MRQTYHAASRSGRRGYQSVDCSQGTQRSALCVGDAGQAVIFRRSYGRSARKVR